MYKNNIGNNNNNGKDDDSVCVCATSNMCYDELKTKFMLISILIKNKRNDRLKHTKRRFLGFLQDKENIKV